MLIAEISTQMLMHSKLYQLDACLGSPHIESYFRIHKIISAIWLNNL